MTDTRHAILRLVYAFYNLVVVTTVKPDSHIPEFSQKNPCLTGQVILINRTPRPLSHTVTLDPMKEQVKATIRDPEIHSMSSANKSDDTIMSTDAKGTVLSGTLSLINTMIGAGLITIPYAYQQVGLYAGIFITFLGIILAVFTLRLILRLAEVVGGRNTSFAEVCRVKFPMGKQFVDAFVLIQAFGVATSYLVLIGSNMPKIVNDAAAISGSTIANTILERREFWISLFFIFVAFLSTLKSLRSLRYTSYLAIMMITYIFCLVVTYAVMRFKDAGLNALSLFENIGTKKIDLSFGGILSCMSYLIFAFTCQQNMFKVYNELSEPRSIQRGTLSAIFSSMFAGCVYLIVGIFGYLTLGSQTSNQMIFADYASSPDPEFFPYSFSVILKTYDPNLISLLIGRLCLIILVTTCYPNQTHPMRDSFFSLVKAYKSYRSSKDGKNAGFEKVLSSENVIKSHFWNESRTRIVVSLGLALTTYGLAMVATSIDLLVELTGATASNFISIMFPCALFVISEKKNTITRITAMALCIFSLFMMFALLIGKFAQ
ncbi:Amino acid transporter domain-containing protein [Rozella allomycis CSF55]|uniref:Amino acid transporter domain-containing protein n=1 Tax=Rozella allomycis (strain CSF55) TaxID=988480 RepID=A0A075B4G1_ROZAC|nr:Amino acid transporter domain-containing protein [Rozella allomycis CSF55]|eukprot:EPZ36330.1 Amino acid transporter domain-containing protein [Rozella allomycis CSF55]